MCKKQRISEEEENHLAALKRIGIGDVPKYSPASRFEKITVDRKAILYFAVVAGQVWGKPA
jgi:hypothetical protein